VAEYDEGGEMVEYEAGETECMPGGNPMPPTLTEEHLKFLNGNDEVPNRLRIPLWGLFTRHNSLTNIPNEIEMNRTRTLVRCCTRVMGWEGNIDLIDTVQVQRYVELQIQKSRNQGERRLLTPWLQEITRRDEFTDRGNQNQKGGGLLSKSVGFIFGKGR
jgi:hypothetical protein